MFISHVETPPGHACVPPIGIAKLSGVFMYPCSCHGPCSTEALFETTTLAQDTAQASLAPWLFWLYCVCFAYRCSGLQTRERSLKPNPKMKPWIQKGPYCCITINIHYLLPCIQTFNDNNNKSILILCISPWGPYVLFLTDCWKEYTSV